MDELSQEIATREQQLEDAITLLSIEQEKVADLEREQDLQNKSLVVLHQQLELERSRRVANG